MDSHRSRIGALLVIAFVIRAGWAVAQPADDASIDKLPDQREYLLLGQNLLLGQGLHFYDPRFRDEVYAFRTPGYPLFVAACGGNVRVVRVVQALIDTSTVLAIYLLARHWLEPGAALFAPGIVAFNPYLIYFTGLVLTETVFTSMLAWGMVLLVGGRGGDGVTGGGAAGVSVGAERKGASSARGTEPGRADPIGAQPRGEIPRDGSGSVASAGWGATLRWLLGGLLLALSVLVRQSAIGLPVVLGIGAALVNRRHGGPYHRRWPLPVGTTMLLLTLTVLAPWAYRNSRVLGSWVWTATNGGITLYDGFNPDATGASDQSFVQSMPQLRGMNEVARSAYLSELAKDYIRRQPLRAAELAAAKAARTWSPVPLSQDYGGWKYRAVGLLYSLPLDVLVLIGLLRRTPGGGPLTQSAKAFLLLPAIYFTAVHMLSVGSLRYRVPAEPPMAVVAASAAFLPGVAGWKRATRGTEVVPPASE